MDRDGLADFLRRRTRGCGSSNRLTLDCQNLIPENVSERLVVFSAAPGSVDEARLRMPAELAAAPLA